MANFHDKFMEQLEARLAYIEKNKNALVEAWVAQHGFAADECTLVQETMPTGQLRIWVERRGESEELKRYREREPLVDRLLSAARDAALCMAGDGIKHSVQDVHDAVDAVNRFDLAPPRR
jgi:hypothetical protein